MSNKMKRSSISSIQNARTHRDYKPRISELNFKHALHRRPIVWKRKDPFSILKKQKKSMFSKPFAPRIEMYVTVQKSKLLRTQWSSARHDRPAK